MIIAVSPGKYEFSALIWIVTFKITLDIASSLITAAPRPRFHCQLLIHRPLYLFHGLPHNERLLVAHIDVLVNWLNFCPELILDLSAVIKPILTEGPRQIIMEAQDEWESELAFRNSSHRKVVHYKEV
jgi:hypothetical protein